MQFIDIPTEQTTAITDVLLALSTFFFAFCVYRTGKNIDKEKTLIWTGAFGLIGSASLLGAFAHGIKMTDYAQFLIWQPLNLFLGIAVALFAAGVIYDWRGSKLPRIVFILLIFSGILFYAITLFIRGSFLVFIIYESVVMIFSLTLYFYLWAFKRFPGAQFMTAGIFITIVAAVVQAVNNISLTVIWEFDHNGLFHIIQMAGFVFLLLGLNTSFKNSLA